MKIKKDKSTNRSVAAQQRFFAKRIYGYNANRASGGRIM